MPGRRVAAKSHPLERPCYHLHDLMHSVILHAELLGDAGCQQPQVPVGTCETREADDNAFQAQQPVK